MKLRELLGLGRPRLALPSRDRPPSKAVFDDRQIASDRISAVQYIRFELTDEQRARWREGVRLLVDHPHYLREEVLTADQVAELARDFED